MKNETRKQEIFFSFFMFTADLQPNDKEYTKILIQHLQELSCIGYDGFDMHIAPQPVNVSHQKEVESYVRLKEEFNKAGITNSKFCTNVGSTPTFDPTSPYKEQRTLALSYLKSRVDITYALGGEGSIMSGPFLYPYGAFPITDSGESLWSDALQDWMKSRYTAAYDVFQELTEYAYQKKVKLAIEPIKNWESPPPNNVSQVLDFLDAANPKFPCGVAIDTAQVVLENQGPAIFKDNVRRAVEKDRLTYIHISAPDRGQVLDSWIPWEIMLKELESVYFGPYLVEVFNAVPPFESSMRMTRRRFWRPGEDKPEANYPSAYDVARTSLEELQKQLAKTSQLVQSINLV
jgi:sugar phosphate isomerase/epimerase